MSSMGQDRSSAGIHLRAGIGMPSGWDFDREGGEVIYTYIQHVGLPNWVSNECTLWSLARVSAGRLLSAVRVLARRVTVAGS